MNYKICHKIYFIIKYLDGICLYKNCLNSDMNMGDFWCEIAGRWNQRCANLGLH